MRSSRNRPCTRTVVTALALVLVSVAWPTGAGADDGLPAPGAARRAHQDKGAGAAPADPDRVLVQFRGRGAAVDQRLAAMGARVERDLPVAGWALVATPRGRAQASLSRLAADPAVESVEPNRARKAFWTPTDPMYSTQASFLTPMRMPRAWDRTRGAGVKVAVLDTGVDLDHPDLAGRLLPGNNFVTPGASVQDDHGHGTAVSGIIAAAADNGKGIAGVANEASVIPVKVLDGTGAGYDSDIASGIVWATDAGADVINLSLGSSESTTPLAQAVAYALSRDVVVVAAAGNDGTGTYADGSVLRNYPAAYDGVVAVGATSHSGQEAVYFSTPGWYVDVAAPGITVLSTMLGAAEAYNTFDGTSFASPIVAGVAALVRANEPAMTQAAVAARIITTARDRGAHGVDPHFGHGVVDALAAVGGPLPAPAPRVTEDSAEPNDAPARAKVLTTTATESISPEGDEDWWAVDLTSGAAQVEVVPPLPDSLDDPRGLDPMLEVYGPNEALVASADVNFLDEPETVAFSVATPGRYLVRVRNWYGSISPGLYQISLSTAASGTSAAGAPFWIRETVPADRAMGLAGSVVPSVQFARAMNVGTVTSSTVRLYNGRTGAAMSAAVGWNAAQNRATLTPASPLAAGPYVVRIEGVQDAVGRTLYEESFRFTVGAAPDMTPPTTTLTGGPATPTSSASATWSFTSNEGGGTFDCRVDGGVWQACTSPATVAVAPGTHVFEVFSRDAAGNEDPSPESATWQYVPNGARFNALPPARLLDTRFGNGAPTAKLGAGASLDLQVTGRGGVPASGVSAVVLNVTVTNPTEASYLVAWPAGEARPVASNLNFVAGQTVPNLVTVKLGTGGRVSLFNAAGSTDLIADVAGWYGAEGAASGSLFNALPPARLLDTRFGNGAPTAKLGAGASLDLQVTGRGGVPASGVSAVVLNVTVTNPTEASYLVAWPAGEARPVASNLNYTGGQTVPNLVVVKLGTGGRVSLFNAAGSTDLIADVAGWYGADGGPTGAFFSPLPPARLLDTRSGNGAPAAKLGAGASLDLQVTGRGGVPAAGVSAVVLNVTVTNPTQPSYLVAWPAGQVQPLASNLNFVGGQTVPNLVVVKLGTGGRVSLFNASGTTDLIADVAGWYTDPVT